MLKLRSCYYKGKAVQGGDQQHTNTSKREIRRSSGEERGRKIGLRRKKWLDPAMVTVYPSKKVYCGNMSHRCVAAAVGNPNGSIRFLYYDVVVVYERVDGIGCL
jgi:hypothetical protein